MRTPIDGYNWRKYGQKQVKSPEGSRSYYKCTYNECEAKKIESCDQYNSITKIVYKGQHKHEQPKKVLTRRGKVLSSSKGQERKFTSKLCKSSGPVSNGPILVEEMDAPPPKRRQVIHIFTKLHFWPLFEVFITLLVHVPSQMTVFWTKIAKFSYT